jgi:protein O-GlcNAc transferase
VTSSETTRHAADMEISRGHEHEDARRPESALRCYEAAVVHAPDYPRAHLNVANALRAMARNVEAEAALRHALRLDPTYAPALYNLGKLHAAMKATDLAIADLREALVLAPNWADAAVFLASLLDTKETAAEAEALLRHATQCDGGSLGAWHNLGMLLRDQNRLEEANDAFQRALALAPDFVDARIGLGTIALQRGDARAAGAQFEAVLERSPQHWEGISSLLFSLNLRHDLDAVAIFRRHVELAHRVADNVPAVPRSTTSRTGRPLRVGYVSGDFRHHPISLFLRPVLAHHDRSRIEAYCYAEREVPCALIDELHTRAHRWRDITDLDDDAAAAVIAADGIDLLIDLSGYTARSRLRVFLRRPAPVQASWLGYLCTTALPAIDFHITDSFADPDGVSEGTFTETLVRLPHSQWCYQPYYDVPLPTTIPRVGPPVYGAFNQFAKLTDACLAYWCEVLRRTPGSCLRVLDVPDRVSENSLRQRVAAHGIDPGRVETLGRLGILEYFAAIAAVDVALDTFPYNGATTTLDTLWMGTPLIALRGATSVARSSASILNTLGASEWIANTPDDWVERTVAIAGAPREAAGQREALRARLLASKLMDAVSFTRGLEDAFERMCATRER